MLPDSPRRSVLALGAALGLLLAPGAHAMLIGPSEYLCFDASIPPAGCGAADSPFKTVAPTLDYFFLEDFEDHLLNTPGVTGNGQPTNVLFPLPGADNHDSVDADDGAIDGLGQLGDSYFSFSGPAGLSFTFDAGVLGRLPTHVGIVWTDGEGASVTFEAFDENDQSLGTRVGTHLDGSTKGTTAEDRFYGAINAGGISRIHISNTAGGIEVDHLQYGGTRAAGVPEPETLALTALAMLGAGWIGRRRRRALPRRTATLPAA